MDYMLEIENGQLMRERYPDAQSMIDFWLKFKPSTKMFDPPAIECTSGHWYNDIDFM